VPQLAREISQTGAMITRRYLNVQPTVKVPVGHKFTVRVNREIMFDAPYEPLQDRQELSATIVISRGNPRGQSASQRIKAR
jgi:hypothetical protein